MEQLTLTTPSILFSAISLIMLAYTNRFLSYAQIVRTLHKESEEKPSISIRLQLENLRKRIVLTRAMQILGLFSLLLCLLSTIAIYFGWQMTGVWLFAVALVSLSASLVISIVEIIISTKAINLQLEQTKERTDKR